MFCVQIWLCKKHTPIQLNGRSLSPVKLISYIVALPDSFDKMMIMMSVLCNGKKSNSTQENLSRNLDTLSKLLDNLDTLSKLLDNLDTLSKLLDNQYLLLGHDYVLQQTICQQRIHYLNSQTTSIYSNFLVMIMCYSRQSDSRGYII